MSQSTLTRLLFICVMLAMPQVALAHMPIKGVNNFYNGFLHPVFVPAHLLLLVSFGLLIGQKGLDDNSVALAAYAGGDIIGLMIAWFSAGGENEIYVLCGATLVGLLIASNLYIRFNLLLLISVLAGLILGMDSAQETLTGKDEFVSLFGSGVAIYFLVLYPMIFADNLQKKSWGKIGVRIIGSWIAASSMLVLALSLTYRG